MTAGGRGAPVIWRQNRRAKKNQPQAYRPWLVFNCVLLQQSGKFD